MNTCSRCMATYFEDQSVPDLVVKSYYSGYSEVTHPLCEKCTRDLKAFLRGANIEGKHRRSKHDPRDNDCD